MPTPLPGTGAVHITDPAYDVLAGEALMGTRIQQ
jgi:hypothetical protein